MLAAVSSYYENQQIPDSGYVDNFIPELCRLVIGQSYDLKAFTASDAIGQEILSKWRQTAVIMTEAKQLSEENEGLKRKLHRLGRKLARLTNPVGLEGMKRETAENSARIARLQSQLISLRDDRYRLHEDGGIGYDHLVSELKSKCFRKSSKPD
jgi:hypothetical protein